MLLNCLQFPQSKWFIMRNQLQAIKKSTLLTFWTVCRKAGVSEDLFQYNAHGNFIIFRPTEVRIDLFEGAAYPRDPEYDRFGSLEFTGGWIDEAQEVEFGAFDTLKSRVGRCLNDQYGLAPKLLLTCNPEKNWLYTKFYRPWTVNELPKEYAFIKSLASDNPYTSKHYTRSLDEIESTAKRQRLRDGIWEYDTDPNQLIRYEWINDALGVEPLPGPARLGIDVAGGDYGHDKNAIVRVVGNMVYPPEYMRFENTGSKLAEELLADHVIKMAEESMWPVPAKNIVIDTVGVGAGLWAVLKAKGWLCRKFNGADHPEKRFGSAQSYANLRAQALWELREKLRLGQLHLTAWDQRMADDLQAYRYFEEGRAVFIEDKRRMVKRLGRSPDGGDALSYAAWDHKGVAIPAARGGSRAPRPQRETREI